MNRIWRFLRDYIDEFPVAWSIARTRDCERNGGHRYGDPELSGGLLMRTCSRCGCGESVSHSRSVATGPTLTVYCDNTTYSRSSMGKPYGSR